MCDKKCKHKADNLVEIIIDSTQGITITPKISWPYNTLAQLKKVPGVTIQNFEGFSKDKACEWGAKYFPAGISIKICILL